MSQWLVVALPEPTTVSNKTPPTGVDVELAHIELAAGSKHRRQRVRGPATADMASNGRPRVVLQKGHNGWYAAKIVIRVAAFAFEIAGIVLVQNLYTDPDQQVDADQIAILTVPVCGCALFWDLAEFITLFARRKSRLGIAAKAHIGLELTLFLAFLACAGMLGFTAAENNYFFGGQEPRDFAWERVRFINPQPRITAIFVLLVLSCIAHFILFVRACIDRSRRSRTAKIMWLPSGHPVVVVPESVAARIAKGDVSLSAAGVPDLKLGSKPQSQLPLSSTAPDNGVLLSAPPPIHLAAGGAPPPDSIGTPSLDSQQLRPSQTSESSPPPPEYAPDPAELARRRRGEAQPQWMTLEHLPGYQGQQATPKGGGAHGSAAANAQQSEPLPSGSQPQGQQGSLTTGVTTADSERHVATTDGGERRDAEDVEAPAPPLPPRPLPGQGVLVERSDGEAVEASAPPLPPRPLPGQGVLGPVARKPVPNQSPTGT